jgi:pyridinium-3,5-biscarboxylic acid mononucleotide sulfurtransferase
MSEPIPENLQQKINCATDTIRRYKGAVVALSAGVDSSLVALLAHRALGDSAVAVTGQSESLPPEELEVAKNTARTIGIRHMIVKTNELENPDYSANPENRCYYCKETLYSELRTIADSLELEAIFDGTQVDDLSDDRPGLQAAREVDVVSPLLAASFSKAEVREATRLLGLSVWDKPAMPCLSSRVVHGEEITPEKLNMIGQAELYIRQLTGVRNLRVRYASRLARIEVSPEERKKLFDEDVFDQIDRELRRLGFERVTLDLRGYSRIGLQVARDPMALPMASVAR